MNRPMIPTPRRQVDRRDHGYAWVVLGSCFVLRTLIEGFWSSIGIIMLQLEYHFDVSASRTAVIGSCIMMMIFSLCKYDC